MATSSPARPMFTHRVPTVAVISPHDVVRAGFEALVESWAEIRFDVPCPPRLSVVRPETAGRIDHGVALVDSLCVEPGRVAELEVAVADRSTVVVILARREAPRLTDRALDLGADGCLSLHSTRAEIHAALAAARRGTLTDGGGRSAPDYTLNPFPAPTNRMIESLTARQVEILAMITLGKTNEEIVETLYLSLNSVKSHIRTAYRRIGVTERVQAALWGHQYRISDIARRRERARSEERRNVRALAVIR